MKIKITTRYLSTAFSNILNVFNKETVTANYSFKSGVLEILFNTIDNL